MRKVLRTDRHGTTGGAGSVPRFLRLGRNPRFSGKSRFGADYAGGAILTDDGGGNWTSSVWADLEAAVEALAVEAKVLVQIGDPDPSATDDGITVMLSNMT